MMAAWMVWSSVVGLVVQKAEQTVVTKAVW